MSEQERAAGPREVDHRWRTDETPKGIELGADVLITGSKAFARFFGERPDALTIGDRSIMDGVRFGVGTEGRITIGSDCRFSDAVIVAEDEVTIGDRVILGWNTTIADSDLHPVDPSKRRLDAEAVSPIGDNEDRPSMAPRPVKIGSDTWVGPNAVILKGVQIGEGCFIEPGSVVTDDIPARQRVLGNPAVAVETL
jgi:acetyltransferase-like isoleucine patch superfamily enzyme